MIRYPDGGRGFAWSGRHLTSALERCRPGDLWSSRNPCILGSLLRAPPGDDELVDHVWSLVAENPVRDWPNLSQDKIPLAQWPAMRDTIRQVLGSVS